MATIEAATGVTIDTISGEEESRLAYLAVRADLPSDDGALVVFDTGGGSTQFTFGRGAEVDDRFSVDVGAVRYTERFGLDTAVSTETLQAVLDAVASDLHRLDGRPVPDALGRALRAAGASVIRVVVHGSRPFSVGPRRASATTGCRSSPISLLRRRRCLPTITRCSGSSGPSCSSSCL